MSTKCLRSLSLDLFPALRLSLTLSHTHPPLLGQTLYTGTDPHTHIDTHTQTHTHTHTHKLYQYSTLFHLCLGLTSLLPNCSSTLFHLSLSLSHSLSLRFTLSLT